MNMLSYGGDRTCKQQALTRLHALEQAGEWVAHPIHWNGQTGSLVGSLLQGEDLDEWGRAFGLPSWLALVLDGQVVMAPEIVEGVRRGIEILRAIPVGVDLRAAGNRCLIAFLECLEDKLASSDSSRDMSSALHAVADLHRRRLAGREVPAAKWREIRRQASALAEALIPGSPEAAAGNCIAAAAWDPATSRSVVSDTLWNWSMAMAAVTQVRDEWRGPERDRIQALLGQMHTEGVAEAGNSDAYIDVFKRLEQKHPQDWKILKAHIDHERELEPLRFRANWERACDILQSVLKRVDEDAPQLIPREHLFANPARAGLAISPDGRWLAWLANVDGVMNLWAAPSDDPESARQLTFDVHRGLQGFSWTYTPGLLLYSQDRDGDENWRLFGVDAASGEIRNFSPEHSSVRAGIHSISRKRRGEVLITLNERDPRYPDLYCLDLRTGELELLEENPGFAGFLTDDDYRVRMAIRSTALGGAQLLTRADDGQWQTWLEISPEDARTTGPSHFSADGRMLYFRDSRGRDTAALTAIELASGKRTVLAQDPRADIGHTLNDPVSYRPLAYGVTYERYRLHVLDESIRADVDFLDAQDIGEWSLSSRTEDDRLWLVSASSDIRPSAAWLYDRQERKLSKLYDVRPELADAPLARMRAVMLSARDGLKLVSYLTLPRNAETSAQPLPLVMYVHGGPWSRDVFGYDAGHQWLANRGYAVLSVNFRSSTGFGKSFIRAGDGEWGRKMDEDLEDAVQWAIDQGYADPARLAIFGASYGGYAVLSALSRYPHRYACGVDVVGPSNLETLLASIPPYWESARAQQYQAIGNPETPDGQALLRDRSPLHRAKFIRAPLLIAQGANDPRVKQAESEQMVTALKANGIPVTYALYPDEGHGFVREPNRMSFNALVERFLARHLGGRDEGWSCGDYPGNTLQIVESGEHQEA